MNRQQMTEKLEQYRQENGTYDVAAVIRDEQPEADDLSLTFATYFGEGDADTPAGDSPLVALARELNEALASARDAENQAEIEALAAELETATAGRRNEILNRLVALGAGEWTGDSEELEFVWHETAGGPYDDQGGIEENAGRTTWGGPRPGAGRPPRYDGRTSQILRVAVTDEEMQAIIEGTDPDTRREVLLDCVGGYIIAGRPFKRSLAQYRRWIEKHGEAYPELIWLLVEAIVPLKVLRVHEEERYHALVVRYSTEDVDTAERVAAEYMHQRMS